MSTEVGNLIAEFCDALEPGERLDTFVQRAEAVDCPSIARMFRAVIRSEEIRVQLFRAGIAGHANDPDDFYVCPHCGLVYEHEPPEKCVVDETPSERFERVH